MSPSPSSSLTTLRPDLSASLMEFDLAANQANFIGTQVMPVIDVASKKGTFGKIPIEQLLQSRDTERAPGSGYNRGQFTFSKASYDCVEHGAEEPVDDSEAEMYAEYFDAEVIAAQRAQHAVLLNHEIRVAAALFGNTTLTGAATSVTNEWDDATNATPVDDVKARVHAIWDATGLWSNGLVINHKVFDNLRHSDQVRDRIASSGAGDPTKARDITIAMLQAVFDLDYIMVGGGAKNTAAEGQSASVSEIWSGEYAAVGRFIPPGNRDPRFPGFGRTFHWGGDGSSPGTIVESYRDEPVRSNVIRARNHVDEVTLYLECVQLLDNITTT